MKIINRKLLTAISILICLLFFSSVGMAANNPPVPNKTFYGDANGDQLLMADDIGTHKDYAARNNAPGYDTTQPSGPSQYWNTCDLNGDNLCMSDDIGLLDQGAAGRPIPGIGTWELTQHAGAVGGNDGEWIPIQLSARVDKGGAVYNGRPGINIRIQVAADSPLAGEVAGLECNPLVSGAPKQATADPSCALLTSITDWSADPDNAPTETGAYELKVRGFNPGAVPDTLIIVADIMAKPILGVPADSIRLNFTVNPAVGNNPPNITSIAPITATEDVLYTYNIVSNDLELDAIKLELSASDSCGGAIVDNGDGAGTYTMTPAGPTPPATCTVGVEACDFAGSGGCTPQDTVVAITSTNEAPTITNLPATENGPVSVADSYDVDVTDPESPPQTLTFNNGGDTCSFAVNVNGADGVTSWTCGSGAETCTANVTVTDDGAPPLNDTKVLTIDCQVPTTVSIDCSNPGPNPVDEEIQAQCAVAATGGTPSIDGGSDTCGGAINGAGPWTYDYTPTEADGPGSCVAAVINGTATDFDTVNINEVNQTPYWTNIPSSILVVDLGTPYSGVNGTAVDLDEPFAASGDPGYLTCSVSSTTCGFAVTATGSGAGGVDCNLSFNAPVTTTNCSVDIEVSDGYSATITKTIDINVIMVWYVDLNATGVADGSSWSDAFTSIGAALAVAGSGEAIWISQGTYVQNIVLVDGVMLFGGFDQTELSTTDRDWAAATTTIDGNNAGSVIIGENNTRVDGFTITRGSATNGGGINNNKKDFIVVENCIFTGNTATGKGGAIFSNQSDITYTNVVFDSNAANNGAAIYNDNQSNPVLIDCVFTNNITIQDGGAIYNKNNNSDMFLNCLFAGNSAGRDGGAMLNFGSAPTIQNSTITTNSAGRNGGGIHNKNGGTIVDTILWGNTAVTAGSQMFDTGPVTAVTYSDIQGGRAGVGNINLNPLFTAGPKGNYYLSNINAGEAADSPCIDTGSITAVLRGLDKETTRTDGVLDTGAVDMGYHYLP